MMIAQRYTVYESDGGGLAQRPDPNGAWVRFEDLPKQDVPTARSALCSLHCQLAVKSMKDFQAKIPLKAWLESQAFYELCQSYRHVPLHNQHEVVKEFEALKNEILLQAVPPPCDEGLWGDIIEFLRDHEDVVDGDYGESAPNRAMTLLQRIGK